jgi:tRNA threonylcarbamoyl adenosine modification protein YeaZ
LFIVAQTTYTEIEVGLHDGAQLIEQIALHKHSASAELIPTIDTMLTGAGIIIADITGIIINSGPAPFTSLRTLITTMNGIAFASHIPLYGASLFEILMHAYDSEASKTVLILFPAYSGHYYYGLRKPGSSAEMGICTRSALPSITDNEPLVIVGMHDDALSEAIVKQYRALTIIKISYSTLQEVAAFGLMQIKKQMPGSLHVSPCYIKTHF